MSQTTPREALIEAVTQYLARGWRPTGIAIVDALDAYMDSRARPSGGLVDIGREQAEIAQEQAEIASESARHRDAAMGAVEERTNRRHHFEDTAEGTYGPCVYCGERPCGAPRTEGEG